MHLLKQVERAFSVCGTIEYMAPEIVEGGESGHDKVICSFMLNAVTPQALLSVFLTLPPHQKDFSFSLLAKLKSWVAAFMHSRRWTGGASACWCMSFWLAARPSPSMEMRTHTQTLPSMNSPWSAATVFHPAFGCNVSTTLIISISHDTGGF